MTTTETATQIETTLGSRKVISSRNSDGAIWWSRLYVNHGETACHQSAKHSTVAGAKKWAAKILAR